jgi:hypothetical protein
MFSDLLQLSSKVVVCDFSKKLGQVGVSLRAELIVIVRL